MTKDIILFINAIRPETFDALREHQKRTGRIFKPVVIVDEKIQESITERNAQVGFLDAVERVSANFDSAFSIRQALRPYADRTFAVTAQYENSILELKKIIPYLPYLPTPSEPSLVWATEKREMRALLEAYNPALVPKYREVHDCADGTIRSIETDMPYPLIVKPSGLEGSLLVSLVHNGKELHSALKHVFSYAQEAYDTWIKRQTPAVLVEEFMEGDMYSVDTYVAEDGTCRHAPPVKVITGHKAGFEDFFGYKRIAPSGLSPNEIRDAYHIAGEACHALGLRAITVHTELMRTPEGWKVIEVGPRIGGYRHAIYSLSFGINHIMNDIQNRAGEEPDIPGIPLSHTAVFNIYAHEEGILTAVSGVGAVRRLASFVSLRQTLHPGEELYFAKHNGDPVFEVILNNKDLQQFESDIESLQQMLTLRVRAKQ